MPEVRSSIVILLHKRDNRYVNDDQVYCCSMMNKDGQFSLVSSNTARGARAVATGCTIGLRIAEPYFRDEIIMTKEFEEDFNEEWELYTRTKEADEAAHSAQE